MSQLSRREFLQVMGVSAAAFSAAGCKAPARLESQLNQRQLISWAEREYNRPLRGQFRVLHLTDSHAQLKPMYFREPNVNLGFHAAYNRPPHLVGNHFLNYYGIRNGTNLAYAYTYRDFARAAELYGAMGGYAAVATVMQQLREAAGGVANSITLDGGDCWQGSAVALWTRGQCMVEASNLLGIDFCTGHWEFSYKEQEVLKNLGLSQATFIAQNVRVKEEALMFDDYYTMVDRHNGIGLYDEDVGYVFKPYGIKEVNGFKVAVIGQAFPRTANANPAANFPDWSFGLRLSDLQALVNEIRQQEQPTAVILLSHNGTDVDLKLASQINGIDVIFGGHTHDAMPEPVIVENAQGKTFVTNAGSNGKYLGVMDFEVKNGRLSRIHYNLLPIFSEYVKADSQVESYIDSLYARQYDRDIVESGRSNSAYHDPWLGKSYAEILSQPLAQADQTLYRRGNVSGTWDQLIVDALRAEYDTQLAFSPGVRWGTSIPQGQLIRMDDVMNQTSISYAESYRSEITGEELKNRLEGFAENLFNADPYLQSGGDMVRVGGMNFAIDPNQSFGQRITDMQLDNGQKIVANKTYTTAGWAQVDQIGEGRLVWHILRDYISSNGSKLNIFNQPKIESVASNKGIERYQPSI